MLLVGGKGVARFKKNVTRVAEDTYSGNNNFFKTSFPH